MDASIKYYCVESVSEKGNQTKYLKLFDVLGVPNHITMLVITGHENTYSNESVTTNSDMLLFQGSTYIGEEDYKMAENIEWKLVYSNIRLLGKELKVVYGYEIKEDGERAYGLYLTDLCSCKVFLQYGDNGWGSPSYYFAPMEVDKSKITIIKEQTYQDTFKSAVTPTCVVTGMNPSVISYDGSYQNEFYLYFDNTDYFNISFLKDFCYVTNIVDADNKEVKYDGQNGGYQIHDCKMPIKISIYGNKSNINKRKDNYYFAIVVGQKIIQIVNFPLSSTVIIGSPRDINNYRQEIGLYITRKIDNDNQRAFCCAGENNGNALLAPISTYPCSTSKRPTDAIKGECCLDTTLNKLIWWDGTKWIDAYGNPADANKKGTTEERPLGVQIGYIYKDTTLNKLIIWNGSSWVNIDGSTLS